MGITSSTLPSASIPPGPLPQRPQEQNRIDGLKAQYAGTCACAQCGSQPVSADAMLKQIRAESYADIMSHEQAHKSAAGAYGGSIVINYDGNGVAIGGHVPIHFPALDGGDPAMALKAYKTIYSAALAPHDPSGQDRAVASQAQSMMGKAQVMMNMQRQDQRLTGQGGLPFFNPPGGAAGSQPSKRPRSSFQPAALQPWDKPPGVPMNPFAP